MKCKFFILQYVPYSCLKYMFKKYDFLSGQLYRNNLKARLKKIVQICW